MGRPPATDVKQFSEAFRPEDAKQTLLLYCAFYYSVGKGIEKQALIYKMSRKRTSKTLNVGILLLSAMQKEVICWYIKVAEKLYLGEFISCAKAYIVLKACSAITRLVMLGILSVSFFVGSPSHIALTSPSTLSYPTSALKE